jgi:hypothetical protein
LLGGSAGPAPEQALHSPLVTFIELDSVYCLPCKAIRPVMADEDALQERHQAMMEALFEISAGLVVRKEELQWGRT